jgi:cellulose biosynthesis protein BcsQ
MGKVVAVYSMKGGVGKSSLAVNLGWEASHGREHSAKALIWDVDAQGAASFLLGETGAGMSVSPGGGTAKRFSHAMSIPPMWWSRPPIPGST